MMLMARSDDLWLPGRVFVTPEPSARAEQIARSREELLKLLADLPEPEHELSFTDLVENVTPVASERRGKAWNSDEDEEMAKEAAKEIVKSIRRDSKRVKRCSGSFGNHGGGSRNVLLNVYVPPSLTLNLTPSRSRRSPSSRDSTPTSMKREKNGSPLGTEPVATSCCWPSIWAKGGKIKTIKE